MRVVIEYADLYKRIDSRFGRLESTVMLGPVRGTLVTFTSELLSAIRNMMNIAPADVSQERWEGGQD